jgi:hypothetical protein
MCCCANLPTIVGQNVLLSPAFQTGLTLYDLVIAASTARHLHTGAASIAAIIVVDDDEPMPPVISDPPAPMS